MFFLKKPAPPVINMGGLYRFERAHATSGPALIDGIVRAASTNPDAPLPPDMSRLLVDLLAQCLGGTPRARRRAIFLIVRVPYAVSDALRQFLDDPLPAPVTDGGGRAARGDIPSVLDMRAIWLSDGGDPAIFDSLTLWEHGRILKEREARKRAALADATLAARNAQAKPNDFKRFMKELSTTGKDQRPNAWVQGLFAATAHLPTVTQKDLAGMKGTS